MPGTLNDTEVAELIELGKRIYEGLSCDADGTGLPCRSDRLQAVGDMVRYLKIHDFYVAPMQD
tara:strand:+ start:2716 stop:2904 length:189 start_codon:yes stop_codon:yes gene_type:complete